MKVEVHYQGNSTFKNVVSCSLSVMTITLFGIITIYFGLEIFQKEEPIVRFYDEFVDESRVYFKDFLTIFFALIIDESNFLKSFKDLIEVFVESRIFSGKVNDGRNYNEQLILDRCQEELIWLITGR